MPTPATLGYRTHVLHLCLSAVGLGNVAERPPTGRALGDISQAYCTQAEMQDVCSIPESGGSWHPLVPEATAASAGGAVRGASQFHHPLSIGLRNNHPPLNNSRRALGNSQTLPAEGKWDPTLKVTLRAVLEFLKRYSVLRR